MYLVPIEPTPTAEEIAKAFPSAMTRAVKFGDHSAGAILPRAFKVGRSKDAKTFRQARRAADTDARTTARQLGSPKPQRFV